MEKTIYFGKEQKPEPEPEPDKKPVQEEEEEEEIEEGNIKFHTIYLIKCLLQKIIRNSYDFDHWI